MNVQVPALFKAVVDTLNLEITSGETVWVVAGSLILGCKRWIWTDLATVKLTPHLIPDGTARIGATLFSELLNAVFASIGQRAVRRVARETFEHLLDLDLKFHLSRQTGGLTRAIDRGTKCVEPLLLSKSYCSPPHRGITFVLQSVLFRIAPTALEVSLVCGILVRCIPDHPRVPPSYVVAGTYRRTSSDGTLLPSRSWRWLRIRGSRFAPLQGGKHRLCTRIYISHTRHKPQDTVQTCS